MTLKFPPPPFMTGELQALNRWLLELTSILTNQGFIDPAQVEGLLAAYVQIAANTLAVTTLSGQVVALSGQVTTLSGQTATNTSDIAALGVRVTALEARGEILNGLVAPANGLGKVNDWYTDTVAKHIYVKTGVATWTLIV